MAVRNALFASTLLLCAVAAPALAGGTGDNVVTVAVKNVSLPNGLPGLCRISGVVGDVWGGRYFRKGQPISVKVPCGNGNHRYLVPLLPAVPSNGARLTDPEVLMKSRLGVAHLDDAGDLIWQATQR